MNKKSEHDPTQIATQSEHDAQNTAIESGCVGVAVEILGDKWTAHIISALADKPRRFSQIKELAGGVNPRTLSERLARLEHCGIISKQVVSAMPPHTQYQLTQKGADLLPILQSMAVWGNKYAPGVEQAEPKD